MPSFLALWLILDHLARKQCSLNQLSLMFTVSYHLLYKVHFQGKGKQNEEQFTKLESAWLLKWLLQNWFASRRFEYIAKVIFIIFRFTWDFIFPNNRILNTKISLTRKKVLAIKSYRLWRILREVIVMIKVTLCASLKYAVNTQYSF